MWEKGLRKLEITSAGFKLLYFYYNRGTSDGRVCLGHLVLIFERVADNFNEIKMDCYREKTSTRIRVVTNHGLSVVHMWNGW